MQKPDGANDLGCNPNSNVAPARLEFNLFAIAKISRLSMLHDAAFWYSR